MKKRSSNAIALLFIAILSISVASVFRTYAPSIEWQGYVKPSFIDYAPSGMPDFDQKQNNWGPALGVYTWCGPVAVANSLWWLDSEYESLVFADPVAPPTISDHFPLVRAFGTAFDDHDQSNVFPLVTTLAYLMDTDGLQSHDGHWGTRWQDLENGTKYYLAQQGLAKYFEVHNRTFPDFGWLTNEILNCQDVELFLEFYQWNGLSWYPVTSIPSLESGHFVTCAGVNVTKSQVLISDPWQDAYEAGTAPGRSPVAHPAGHNATVHNDAQYVSQDAYNMTVRIYTPPITMPPPDAYPNTVYELEGYLQTMGIFDNSYHTFVRAAVATSPVAQWPGYTKPAFPDYAPSGMPDFDEQQDAWGKMGTYTWCVPVAVADSLWWLDSEFESLMFANPVAPPTISDHFNLVNSSNPSNWDDHDPNNVMSLVPTLAFLMDTDGLASGDGHSGTRWIDIQTGIQKYLVQQGVANMFEVHNQSFPEFGWIDKETEKCQDVELCIEFWQWNGTAWTNTTVTEPFFQFGHCVACAGVNITTSQVLVCDPAQDAYEAGTVPGREPIPHAYPHNSTVHNDAQYVSQDAYTVSLFNFSSLPPPMSTPPPGYPQTVWELQNYLGPNFHAFIKGAIAVSPELNIVPVNVESDKDKCLPMPTVGKGFLTDINATVVNNGSSAESFAVTVYANSTALGTTTVNNLAPGANVTVTVATWNTTNWAYGHYFLSAATNASYTTFTSDLAVWVVIPGDINGDGTVDIYDAILLSGAFNSSPGSTKWNPNADINCDAVVDIYDAILLSGHFNKSQLYDP